MVAVEIVRQLGRAPDHLVMPVGGGGLSAGMLSYFGTESLYTFVEPAGRRQPARGAECRAPGDPGPRQHLCRWRGGGAIGERPSRGSRALGWPTR
jgi:threonine dehydratase